MYEHFCLWPNKTTKPKHSKKVQHHIKGKTRRIRKHKQEQIQQEKHCAVK